MQISILSSRFNESFQCNFPLQYRLTGKFYFMVPLLPIYLKASNTKLTLLFKQSAPVTLFFALICSASSLFFYTSMTMCLHSIKSFVTFRTSSIIFRVFERAHWRKQHNFVKLANKSTWRVVISMRIEMKILPTHFDSRALSGNLF